MDVFEVLVGLVTGLMVGSFLNVVVHRLPRMMERQWTRDMADWQAQQDGEDLPSASLPVVEPQPYNLARPGSHCPSCGHVIRWHENIPILSYMWLRGRCSACGQAIGWRYPAVELATGLLFAWCLARWGLNTSGWLWSGFCSVLLALALIDWDTQYLPDDLTLPLLWVGLAAAALGLNPWVNLQTAFWGAVAGYLSLWGVYHLFKLATGKEGMGYGDFKLLAALGAWLGWQALLPIILAASLSGAIVGIGMRLLGRLEAGQPMPFGPFLVAAGLVMFLLGPDAWWPSWWGVA